MRAALSSIARVPSLLSSSSSYRFLSACAIQTHARKLASAQQNGGRRRQCSFFSADAAVLFLAEIAALPRRVRAGRAPADLERRLARAPPGIRAFRAPQRHLYLHRLGTMPSDQGTHGAGRIHIRASLPNSRALCPP